MLDSFAGILCVLSWIIAMLAITDWYNKTKVISKVPSAAFFVGVLLIFIWVLLGKISGFNDWSFVVLHIVVGITFWLSAFQVEKDTIMEKKRKQLIRLEPSYRYKLARRAVIRWFASQNVEYENLPSHLVQDFKIKKKVYDKAYDAFISGKISTLSEKVKNKLNAFTAKQKKRILIKLPDGFYSYLGPAIGILLALVTILSLIWQITNN